MPNNKLVRKIVDTEIYACYDIFISTENRAKYKKGGLNFDDGV